MGVVLTLAGLFEAGRGEARMKPAFWCCVGEVAVTVLLVFQSSDTLTILSQALAVLVIYFICSVSSALLEDLGELQKAKWGRVVWKIYLVGTIIITVLPLILRSDFYLFWRSRYLLLFITLGFRFVFTMILLLHLYNVYSTFEEQEQSNGGAV